MHLMVDCLKCGKRFENQEVAFLPFCNEGESVNQEYVYFCYGCMMNVNYAITECGILQLNKGDV